MCCSGLSVPTKNLTIGCSGDVTYTKQSGDMRRATTRLRGDRVSFQGGGGPDEISKPGLLFGFNATHSRQSHFWDRHPLDHPRPLPGRTILLAQSLAHIPLSLASTLPHSHRVLPTNEALPLMNLHFLTKDSTLYDLSNIHEEGER